MSKENDFFGIEYVQQEMRNHDAQDRTSFSPLKPKGQQSGTEFLDSAFFPELTDSNRQQPVEHGNHQSERELVDKDDAFSDYFVVKSDKNRSQIQADPHSYSSDKKRAQIRAEPRQNSSEELFVIDQAEYSPDEQNGIQQIMDKIEPVWRYTPKEIVKLLADRVIYDGEDLIAFDKPYALSYAGNKNSVTQMDKILQDLKNIVAPNADRLHLIKSLDKACTGVVLFAKNSEAKKQYQEKLKEDKVNFEYRTIVKNIPKVRQAEIKVPLRRFLKGNDYELRPLLAATRDTVFYPKTTYRILEQNSNIHSAYLTVDVQNEVPHHIRCHLGFGIGCPILGDLKYSKINDKFTQNLSTGILSSLEVNRNQSRKLPMYLHLREIKIPENTSGSKYISIRAAIPEFFNFTLKRLALLRK